MSIVLNEHYSAMDSIHNKSLGKKPFETLRRVARYYIDKSNGDCNKKNIRDKLNSFLLQCDSEASIPKWTSVLDAAVSKAFKYEAIQIDSIIITTKEMLKIDSLDSRPLRRLAFTLLCLSKYWDAVNCHNDHWVNTDSSEIMKIANIRVPVKKECLMYAKLKELGMIQMSRKITNTNVKTCFNEDGDEAMVITDMRNLGYQYLKYHGEPYFECKNCGITVRMDKSGRSKRGRKQKYCKDCVIEISTQQKVNFAMRRKEIKNIDIDLFVNEFDNN